MRPLREGGQGFLVSPKHFFEHLRHSLPEDNCRNARGVSPTVVHIVDHSCPESLAEKLSWLPVAITAIEEKEVRQSVRRGRVLDQSEVTFCEVADERTMCVVHDVISLLAAQAAVQPVMWDSVLHASRSEPSVPKSTENRRKHSRRGELAEGWEGGHGSISPNSGVNIHRPALKSCPHEVPEAWAVVRLG